MRVLTLILFIAFKLNAFSQDTIISKYDIYKWVDTYELKDLDDPITKAIIYLKADEGLTDAIIECGFALITNDESIKMKAYQVLYVLYNTDKERFLKDLYYDPSVSELIDPDEVFRYFKKIK